METTMKTDLEDFRLETRKWLEENCPASMRKPIKESTDYFWGGRNAAFHSEDQKIWFERMHEKNGLSPIGIQNMVVEGFHEKKTIYLPKK